MTNYNYNYGYSYAYFYYYCYCYSCYCYFHYYYYDYDYYYFLDCNVYIRMIFKMDMISESVSKDFKRSQQLLQILGKLNANFITDSLSFIFAKSCACQSVVN